MNGAKKNEFWPIHYLFSLMFEQIFAGRSPSTQKLDDFRKSLRNLYMNGAKKHRKSKKLLSFLISDWQIPDFASLASLASRHFLQ